MFPDYIRRFNNADPKNFATIDYDLNGEFQAAFFCPKGLCIAGAFLRPFIAINRTYIKSRYRMMLFIAYRIDANENTLPLA